MVLSNKPRQEKTCLRNFQPGKTQTGLPIFSAEADKLQLRQFCITMVI